MADSKRTKLKLHKHILADSINIWRSYHHGLHDCEMWQKYIILHNVTGHFTELPQVAFHTIDQDLATSIFGSIITFEKATILYS